MYKIDEPLSLGLLEDLIDVEIRFRWPDEWGEAFVTGTLVEYEPVDIDGQASVLIQIQHSNTAVAGRILPLGIEVDLWITDADAELDLGDL